MQSTYQVIARRWRPKTFEELVGQEAIVRTLENAIKLNKIAHAFLFTGPRGTGKTSTARLLAMALNAPDQPNIHADPQQEPCLSIFEGHCVDVIEIDGASNNSVEQVRALREECQYAPSFCRFKIYIIDEVHMLSQSAFNALLKTLEEPPSHVKFILATTEAQKIPLTIASRCQRFEFQLLSESAISKTLEKISQAEGIQIEPLAIKAIARLASGGMRDAQSILEQMIAFGDKKITENDVISAYGLASYKDILSLAQLIEESDFAAIVNLSEKLSHCNLAGILSDLERHFYEQLPQNTNSEEIAKLLRIIDVISSSKNATNTGSAPEILFQLTLFRAIEARNLRHIDKVISLLKKLENEGAGSAKIQDKTPTENKKKNTGSKLSEKINVDNTQSNSTPSKTDNLAKNTNNTATQPNSETRSTPPPSSDSPLAQQLPKNTRDTLKNLFRIDL